MTECCKLLLPSINWDTYILIDMQSVANTGQIQSIYDKRFLITIEDNSSYPNTEEEYLWHIHWYAKHTQTSKIGQNSLFKNTTT